MRARHRLKEWSKAQRPCSKKRQNVATLAALAGAALAGYIALTMLSVIFLASPSSIMVLSR